MIIRPQLPVRQLALLALISTICGCEQHSKTESILPRPPKPKNPNVTPTTDPQKPSTAPASTAPVATPPLPNGAFQLTAGEHAFNVSDGTNAPTTKPARLVQVDDPKAPWRYHTVDNRVQHLSVTPDGSIQMVAVEDAKHAVITWFTPPLVIVPANLEVGGKVTQTCTMNIKNIADQTLERDSGSCTQTVTLMGKKELSLPIGTFDVHHFRTEHEAKLKLAHVNEVRDSYYGHSGWLLKQSSSESVKTVILLGWNTKLDIERVK